MQRIPERLSLHYGRTAKNPKSRTKYTVVAWVALAHSTEDADGVRQKRRPRKYTDVLHTTLQFKQTEITILHHFKIQETKQTSFHFPNTVYQLSFSSFSPTFWQTYLNIFIIKTVESLIHSEEFHIQRHKRNPKWIISRKRELAGQIQTCCPITWNWCFLPS